MNIGKMPTDVKRKIKAVSGWDQAISDAKKKISDLEFSIEVFEQAKREDRPFPVGGYKITGTVVDTVPAKG